jgi:hypothetical protein
MCELKPQDPIRLKFERRILEDAENILHLETSEASPLEVVLLRLFVFDTGGKVLCISLGLDDTIGYAAGQIAQLTGRSVGAMVGRYLIRPGFIFSRGQQTLKMDCTDRDYPIVVSLIKRRDVVFRDRDGVLETVVVHPASNLKIAQVC